MRTIKFRVWNAQTKKWVYGPTNEVNLFGETILFGEFMSLDFEFLKHCTALQFTGCTDKNDKEIYEWDIVQLEGNLNTGFVEFIAGMFVLSFPDQTDSGPIGFLEIKKLEIIGNMFENSELFKSPIK